jgi:hypothetical protein
MNFPNKGVLLKENAHNSDEMSVFCVHIRCIYRPLLCPTSTIFTKYCIHLKEMQAENIELTFIVHVTQLIHGPAGCASH